MFIPDPDFCPSRIPNPKTATKEKGEQKFVFLPFYVATNITKLINYLFLKGAGEEKTLGQFLQRIIELFTQKFVIKLSKILVWDPGSGTRKKNIPDSGSRGQKGAGSATLKKLTCSCRTSRVSQPRRMATGMMIGEA
jgi:hypothetical protein